MAEVASDGPGSAAAAPPGREILTGVSQSLAGRAFTVLLQFATLVVLARGLGPEKLGIAQFYFVVFTYLVLLNDPGLSVLGTREHGRATGRLTSPGTLLGARLALSVPTIGIALFLAAISSLPGTGDQGITAILVIATVASAFSLRWLLLAGHAFGTVALIELAAAALQLGGALVVLALGLGGVAGLAVLAGGPTAVAVLTYLRVGLRGEVVRPRFDLDAVRVVRTALPLGIAAFAIAIYYSADSLILGVTRTSGEVGIYAAAYRIVLATLALPVIVHGVALPVVAKSFDRDARTTERVVRGLTGWLMLISIPAAVTIALTAPGIVGMLYGSAFDASALPLSILVFSLVTVSANVPLAVLVLASRRDRAYLAVTVVGAVVNVALNLVIIPRYGVAGAALTTLVSEVVVLASLIALTRPISHRALVRAVPLGLVPAALIAIALSTVSGPLIAELALAGMIWAGAAGLLAATGAMRESLAMLGGPAS